MITLAAALLTFAGRVLIAVSDELIRATETHRAECPATVPDWLDESVDL